MRPINTILRRAWGALGPGLTTGAADDDPSGIATYSQAGAQFGYALTWIMLLTLPSMAAIQLISGLIGWHTKKGLAANIAAQTAAARAAVSRGAAGRLPTRSTSPPISPRWETCCASSSAAGRCSTPGVRLACLLAEIAVPYHSYAGYLKFLTWTLFAYVATAFLVHVPWGEVLRSTLAAASLSLNRDLLLMVVAIFGTTISPYLFFWQASQEAEESRLSHRARYRVQAHAGEDAFRHIAVDTWIGMLVSQPASPSSSSSPRRRRLARMASPRSTRPRRPQRRLRPIAGELDLRAVCRRHHRHRAARRADAGRLGGLCGRRDLRLRGSLELPASRAIGFYAIVGAATLGGAALAATKIDPIAMLFWAAVLNGVVSVPIMAAMMLTVSGKMRRQLALPRWLYWLGWLATALMALAVGGLCRRLADGLRRFKPRPARPPHRR